MGGGRKRRIKREGRRQTDRGMFGGDMRRNKKKPTKERKRGGNKYTEVIVLITVDMWLLW